MITADHSGVLDFRSEPGPGGKTDAFIIRDLNTKFLGGYPLNNKGEDEAYESLQHFWGTAKADSCRASLHSDDAPAIASATKILGMLLGPGGAGRDQDERHRGARRL